MIVIETLRRLCAEHWNPIGVVMAFETGAQDDPAPLPADEYDGYLYEVWKRAKSETPKSELIAYLGKVETEYMGMTRPSGNKALFVDKLLAALNDECGRKL